jgi:7,8-dihydropterin-6-yl-methyl-4-(beta-D-ribofuranosyl)aminobenzene 5'-phosphate synthase
MLLPVDELEVHILVDNVTDGLSSVPSHVEGEMSYLWRRERITEMAGACLCCAAHGLSCLVRVRRGGTTRTLLFDSGPDADVFARNVDRLGIGLGAVEAVVLSHGHWDHAGGMLRALDLIRAENGGRSIPYYCHPAMFVHRAGKAPDGSMRPMADVPNPEALRRHGAEPVVTTEPAIIMDGLAWVSGEIPRRTPYEVGLPGQHRLLADGVTWEPDELLMDERFLAVHVAGKGLVVFSACSHAGIVNVLHHARESFPNVPIHTALGGLHLSGTNERVIPETVRDLAGFGLTTIAAGHCTGWRAMAALYNAFGDKVLTPLAVGKRLVYRAD